MAAIQLVFNNSASPVDLHLPIVVDGVDHGAPIENLKSAMRDAKLTSVDLWIGSSAAPVAKLVVPVLRPKAFSPSTGTGYSAHSTPASRSLTRTRLPRRSHGVGRDGDQAAAIHGQVAARSRWDPGGAEY